MELEILYIIPAIVICFWVLRILTKRPPLIKAHIMAAFSFLCMAFALICVCLFYCSSREYSFVFYGLFCSFFSLSMPLYNSYVRCVTSMKGPKPQDLLLFAPSVIVIVGFIFLFTVTDKSHQNELANVIHGTLNLSDASELTRNTRNVIVIYNVIISIHLLIIGYKTIIEENRYFDFLGEFYAVIDEKIFMSNKTNIIWGASLILSLFAIQNMIFFGLSYIATTIIIVIMLIVNSYHEGYTVYQLEFTSIQVRNQLNQITILPQSNEEKNIDNIDIIENEVGSIINNKNNTKTKAILPKELLLQVEEKKLFTDANLTLISLAEQLNTNRTYLSQAIHYYYGTNLAGFIKEKRINYAKQLLDESDYFNVNFQVVATDSGYANIASFYRDFTNTIGITPKQYMKQKLQFGSKDSNNNA